MERAVGGRQGFAFGSKLIGRRRERTEQITVRRVGAENGVITQIRIGQARRGPGLATVKLLPGKGQRIAIGVAGLAKQRKRSARGNDAIGASNDGGRRVAGIVMGATSAACPGDIGGHLLDRDGMKIGVGLEALQILRAADAAGIGKNGRAAARLVGTAGHIIATAAIIECWTAGVKGVAAT